MSWFKHGSNYRNIKFSLTERQIKYGKQNDKFEVDGGNEMQDKYVLNCPFCGGTEVIESWQDGYGAVTAVSNKWGERDCIILFVGTAEV